MDVSDITAAVIAASGVLGIYTSYRLGKRGQRNDETQQTAAQRLQERIAAFDELESLNERLGVENTRLATENVGLRNLIAEAEAAGNIRLARQAARCRDQITETVAALTALQSVVVAEVAKAAADMAITRADRHLGEEHPDEEPDL